MMNEEQIRAIVRDEIAKLVSPLLQQMIDEVFNNLIPTTNIANIIGGDGN